MPSIVTRLGYYRDVTVPPLYGHTLVAITQLSQQLLILLASK